MEDLSLEFQDFCISSELLMVENKICKYREYTGDCGLENLTTDQIKDREFWNCGHLSCMKYIIERGITIQKTNTYIIDCIMDYPEIFEYLVKRKMIDIKNNRYEYLNLACEKRECIDIIRILLENGLTVDDIRKNNCYILQYCLHDIELLRIIIGTGLTIDDIRGQRNSLIYVACGKGDPDIVDFLISHGLTKKDISTCNNRCLKSVVRSNNKKLLKHLLFMYNFTIEELQMVMEDPMIARMARHNYECCVIMNSRIEYMTKIEYNSKIDTTPVVSIKV